MFLGLADGVIAKVKDRGGQHSAGSALGYALDQVIQRAHPARGDDGNINRVGNGAGERQVKPGPRAIPIHRG